MTTKAKIRTTIELNPGDKERLQKIAGMLGIVQARGPDKGKGSISQLLQVMARDDVEVIIRIPLPPSERFQAP